MSNWQRDLKHIASKHSDREFDNRPLPSVIETVKTVIESCPTVQDRAVVSWNATGVITVYWGFPMCHIDVDFETDGVMSVLKSDLPGCSNPVFIDFLSLSEMIAWLRNFFEQALSEIEE